MEMDLHSGEFIWRQGAAEVHALPPTDAPVPMPLNQYLNYLHPADWQVLAVIVRILDLIRTMFGNVFSRNGEDCTVPATSSIEATHSRSRQCVRKQS
jgi:hypothetical protein